jgi:hypothetical protein
VKSAATATEPATSAAPSFGIIGDQAGGEQNDGGKRCENIAEHDTNLSTNQPAAKLRRSECRSLMQINGTVRRSGSDISPTPVVGFSRSSGDFRRGIGKEFAVLEMFLNRAPQPPLLLGSRLLPDVREHSPDPAQIGVRG